jgi:hypothetical protein
MCTYRGSSTNEDDNDDDGGRAFKGDASPWRSRKMCAHTKLAEAAIRGLWRRRLPLLAGIPPPSLMLGGGAYKIDLIRVGVYT